MDSGASHMISNPGRNIKIYPYQIHIEISNLEGDRNIWCRANIKYPNFWSHHLIECNELYENYYSFSSKKDAMWFCLTWGGVYQDNVEE